MLRTLLVVSLLVPGIVAALASRYWGLLLYLWNAFFRPQDFMWMSTRNLRLSLILGVLFVVPSLLTGVFPNVTHPLSLGTIVFLISGLLAQTNALDQATGWQWLDAQARLTVVCLLAVTLMSTPQRVMGVIAVAAGSLGFYASKAGFASLLGGGVQFAEGLDGTFVDNNGYALATVMTVPMLVALAQNVELTFKGLAPPILLRRIRILLWLAVPLCLYTVVSTFSRGGFIAMVATVFAYALFHPHRKRFVLGMALIGSLAFFVPLPEGYAERIATISQLQEDVDRPQEDVSEGRLYFWGLAVEMVKHQPLGVGMRNFSAQFGSYDELRGAYGRNRDVHSSHFQVLVEHGYLGAAVWIFLFLYSFGVCWRIRKQSRTAGLSPEIKIFLETTPTALMVSMVGFLVGGSAISAALNELTWLTFAVTAALDRLCKQFCAEAGREVPQREPVPFRVPVPAAARTSGGIPDRIMVGARPLQRRQK